MRSLLCRTKVLAVEGFHNLLERLAQGAGLPGDLLRSLGKARTDSVTGGAFGPSLVARCQRREETQASAGTKRQGPCEFSRAKRPSSLRFVGF